MRDEEYLFISGMLKARRSAVLDSERLERLLAADTAGASRLLAEYGFGNVEGLDSAGVDAAMSSLRAGIFNEMEFFSPEKNAVRLFRLKYDCHNAKALVKSAISGLSADRLLSDCGSIKKDVLSEAILDDRSELIPDTLAHAVEEARSTLARTGNPQPTEFILDAWQYSEMHAMADSLENEYASNYVRLLTDCANLRGAVRVLRLGGDSELFALSQLPCGSVEIRSPSAEAISEAFDGTPLSAAADTGNDAVKGGELTPVERLCDSAISSFISDSSLVSFGVECLIAFLAGLEEDLATVRMIMSMKMVGMEPARIRERLVTRL